MQRQWQRGLFKLEFSLTHSPLASPKTPELLLYLISMMCYYQLSRYTMCLILIIEQRSELLLIVLCILSCDSSNLLASGVHQRLRPLAAG